MRELRRWGLRVAVVVDPDGGVVEVVDPEGLEVLGLGFAVLAL